WLAHGTLIGWYFGERMQPFDDDVDLQMNSNYLYELAKYNMTLIDGRVRASYIFYLLDVNPHFISRHHQRLNVIDARFIDTETSLFLDITGMALTKVSIRESDRVAQMTVKCKTPHRMRPESIYPLVRTRFEGIGTWRPNEVADMLKKEYGAMVMSKTLYKVGTCEGVGGAGNGFCGALRVQTWVRRGAASQDRLNF
ncbi:LicD family-domain-containing protein, partial [Blyttiomyces helicus]